MIKKHTIIEYINQFEMRTKQVEELVKNKGI